VPPRGAAGRAPASFVRPCRAGVASMCSTPSPARPQGVPHTPGASVPSAVSRGRSGAARLRYRTDGFIPTDVDDTPRCTQPTEPEPAAGRPRTGGSHGFRPSSFGRLTLTAREGRAAPGLPQRPARRPERVPQSRAERSDVAQRGGAPLTVGDGAATRAGSPRAQRAESEPERSEDPETWRIAPPRGRPPTGGSASTPY